MSMKFSIASTDDHIPRHDFENLDERSIPFDAGRIEGYEDSSRANYPHRHTFYEIHMVRSGSGIHHIDDQKYEIESGAIYLLSPDEVQHWTLHTPLSGSVMIFKEEFLMHASSGVSVLDDLSFFHQLDRGNFFKPDAEKSDHLVDLFDTIITETEERRVGWENVVRSLVHIFLIEIQRSLSNVDSTILPNRNLHLARRFRRLVDRFVITDRHLTFYSEKLNVSPGQMQAVVKEIFDVSPGQMIQEALVREVKRRLVYTDVSIAEIAYALKFEDPSYFSRQFRKSVGQTPTAYRENILKQT